MQILKILFISVFLLNFVFIAFAQELPQGYQYNNNFDLALSAGKGQFMSALSWVHLHGIGKKEKFKIGYGLRFNSAFGSKNDFITAPALLTSGKTGLQVLFIENIVENLDTLSLDKSQVNSLNLSINLQYSITRKFEVGFNIDALGLSFGKTQVGTFKSSIFNDGIATNPQAKPTTFNILLVSDNDRGSLNSELYGRYWLSEKWAIRTGLSFLFTEYTTQQKLALNNDRFRNKSLQFMLGISFSPFRK